GHIASAWMSILRPSSQTIMQCRVGPIGCKSIVQGKNRCSIPTRAWFAQNRPPFTEVGGQKETPNHWLRSLRRYRAQPSWVAGIVVVGECEESQRLAGEDAVALLAGRRPVTGRS